MYLLQSRVPSLTHSGLHVKNVSTSKRRQYFYHFYKYLQKLLFISIISKYFKKFCKGLFDVIRQMRLKINIAYIDPYITVINLFRDITIINCLQITTVSTVHFHHIKMVYLQ